MPKLVQQVRDLIRTLHYSFRTEESYVRWIKQFILFHNKRHPAQMGAIPALYTKESFSDSRVATPSLQFKYGLEDATRPPRAS